MNQLRHNIIFISSLFLLFISSFVFAKEKHFPPDIQRIKQRGTLIVAMYHNDIKPFLFHDKKGHFIGHEVKLAKKISTALGVKVTFIRSPKTFDEIIALVAQEKADMAISLVSRTMKRALTVRFSSPYLTLRPTLLINRVTAAKLKLSDGNDVNALKSFTGRIGEKKGTSYVSIARKIFPNAEIIEYPEWIDTMDAVRTLHLDAALRDEIGVKNYISSYPEQSIQLQMIPLTTPKYADQLAIAMPASSVHLQEWVNLYFKINGTTGNTNNLLEEYRGYYE